MRKIIPLCLLLLLALGAPTVALSGTGRIAFVHITIEKGALALEGVKVVDGDMKHPRRLVLAEGRFYFEVLDVSGNRLFEGTVRNPSVRRLEYADEDGTLHSEIIEVERGFFSVRIPFDDATHRIDFYRIETAGPRGTKPVKAPEAFGSVTIELGEVGR